MNNQSICKALIISYNWLVHVEKQLAKEFKSSKDLWLSNEVCNDIAIKSLKVMKLSIIAPSAS